MRLKLTLARGASSPDDDLVVTADTTATIADVAGALAERDPRAEVPPAAGARTLAVEDGGRLLDPRAGLAEAGLRSGQSVRLAAARSAGTAEDRAQVATLVVLSGPDAGATFPLRAGANHVGRDRDCEVRLSDPSVSKHHARINVTDTIEVIDLGSSNGTSVGGDTVPRAMLRPRDVVQLGDTEVRVEHSGRRVAITDLGLEFNRSPRLDRVFAERELAAPEVPRPAPRPRMPIIPLLAPVVLGMVLFAATRQLVSILFVALSPVMMLGNVLESRVVAMRELKEATERFRAALARLGGDLRAAQAEEAEVRRQEHPPIAELVPTVEQRGPLLWCRRPDARGFLELRLGTGARPSRVTVERPHRGEVVEGLWRELVDVEAAHAQVADVPVLAVLPSCGALGVAGPRASALGVARSVVVQLVALHSPAEVVLAAFASSDSASDWDWLKWLPHTTSDHSPLEGEHLASSPGACARLAALLEDELERRRAAGEDALPAIVVLVEDDTPIERSRLVDLAERGPGVGLHVIWVAGGVTDLPAACRTYAAVDLGDPARIEVGDVLTGELVTPVAPEPVDAATALATARSLAPVADAGARLDDASDLPATTSLVAVVDPEVLRSPAAIIDRWRSSGSLPGARHRRDHHLRASIGQASGQSMVIDLRQDGPHALVGGTTGSGKSEFLQSWVMGMALDHSPAKVTFLFVDYKGGSAFSACVDLPHAVGLVTDLSPHLVRRALTSLDAEVKHRERLLHAKKAKDLVELEERGDPDTPPSLVIVVDEFAALVAEVPEFVDGMVNIAQRGRSLGLHLILATQRPAGVIKDNLRANTNLRVALRMADEDDSTDVIGTSAAAGFDPGIPGRAVAKLGAGRTISFQAGYVGGWTPDEVPPPDIRIESLTFGAGERWEPTATEPVSRPDGPNDLKRLVAHTRASSEQLQLPAPRRPWLDRLADVYDLARAPQSRTDAEFVFGILDVPEDQAQVPVAFHPDRDGNIAVYGTGGTGKTGFLRTLAVVAGLGLRGGPCHVYGLDFGARGLQVLEALPHVGAIIGGDDEERVQRLLRQLRALIDERAVRYAQVNAATIAEYRQLAGAPDEPRVLLLVDGIGAFRQAYELGPNARWFDTFQQIAAEGRQVGVHVALSADRANAVPTGLASVVQRRLVLRLTNESDYLALGAPSDVLELTSPPGRGLWEGSEVQVTVLGGSQSVVRQAAALQRLAADLRRSVERAPAPPVERLPERVELASLPASTADTLVIGVSDATLGPTGIVPDDVLLVAGPSQSGKSTAMLTIARALQRTDRAGLVLLAPGRSPLGASLIWSEVVVGAEDVAEAARKLIDRLESGDRPGAVFVEDISAFISTPADGPVTEVVKACRRTKTLLVTEGETSTFGTWPLQQAVRSARHGLLLQPDQLDGDSLFKTSLPRVARADFVPGRGFYVRAGRAERVQVALPSMEDS